MVRMASSISLALGLALMLGAASSADTAGTTKHSGTVVAVDPQGVMIMEEVGPWRVVQGTTVVTRRAIRLSSATRFNTFIRVDVPGRFAGDFLEVALEAEDIVPGDFVTAECVRERGRLVAVQVTMAELR